MVWYVCTCRSARINVRENDEITYWDKIKHTPQNICESNAQPVQFVSQEFGDAPCQITRVVQLPQVVG